MREEEVVDRGRAVKEGVSCSREGRGRRVVSTLSKDAGMNVGERGEEIVPLWDKMDVGDVANRGPSVSLVRREDLEVDGPGDGPFGINQFGSNFNLGQGRWIFCHLGLVGR